MVLIKESKKTSFSDLPTSPGAYIMKNQKGEVIYVGKALNLRNRVRSYFTSSGDTRHYIRHLTSDIHSLDYIVTDSEKEAFILESTLIKHHAPKYNIRLRDDKSFLSLRIDLKQPFPRIELVRTRAIKKDTALYFGPFSSSSALKKTLQLIHTLFPLRTCTDTVFRSRKRSCLLCQIQQCQAPCVLPVDKDEYRAIVKQAIMLLQGKTDPIVKQLTAQMNQYAQAMSYEKAAQIRDKITSIQNTVERQKVAELKNVNRDVIAHYQEGDQLLIAVLFYRSGMLISNADFKFKIYDRDLSEVFYSFISQFYASQRLIPNQVLISIEPEEKALLEEWLTEQRGGTVKIIVPQRGEKRRMILLAQKNAIETHNLRKSKSIDVDSILSQLQSKLHLTKLPRHIECFDISNIQGTVPYGSMVCFRDAQPSKKNYRLFKIRTIEGSDDYGMMREVIHRRYKRILEEGGELPDMILVDGGKGQLNIAIEVFRELGIKQVNIAGIAKIKTITRTQGRAKTEERIFLPNRKNPVTFKRSSPALHLLQRIRDEAHRFAITHHRKSRSKKALRSLLDEIPGIGPKRKRALLKHFGSLKEIKSAPLDHLHQCPTIPQALAKAIYDHFH